MARRAFVYGDALQGADTATVVRVRDGVRSVTDGPFIEAKEVLVGYYQVKADSLDEALDWAAQIPGARLGGVEVRPDHAAPRQPDPRVDDAGPALEHLLRTESGRVLGGLVRRFGDLDLAEDAFQEACVEALQRWPDDGVPDNPAAWLTTVSRNRALDRVRRERLRLGKEADSLGLREGDEPATAPSPDTWAEADPDDAGPLADDQLQLVLLCCHPALAEDAQVALTLRAVCGLTTGEVAAAFLVPEATMAQRVVRAKRKIALARIPFRLPEGPELTARLATALHVVYLVFNEGYAATAADEPVRRELCAEAVRLARLLADLAPDDPEAVGLLALLLLQDSRRAARVDDEGRLVPLAEQDRTRWDAAQAAEGAALVERALGDGPLGPFQLQAAVAAVHAQAPSAEDTDWAEIHALYRCPRGRRAVAGRHPQPGRGARPARRSGGRPVPGRGPPGLGRPRELPPVGVGPRPPARGVRTPRRGA